MAFPFSLCIFVENMPPMNQQKTDNRVEIFSLTEEDMMREFPFVGTIPAGFPSPADDFYFEPLDILSKYMKHPEAIFIGRAYGLSMDGFIADGDYFYMDRSLRLSPVDGDIAVCAVDGEFTLKRIKFTPKGIDLIPYNDKYPVISVSENDDFSIWAIVTLIIRPTPTRWLRS